MNKKLDKLLESLIIKKESEHIEFKVNNDQPELIGEYISALSNSAAIYNYPNSYLVYGVDDKTREIVGTSISIKDEKKGNEELESWLNRLLEPKTHFSIYEFKYNNHDIVILKIPATNHIPIRFHGTAYVRVGSYKKKLSEYPEKERIIWNRKDKKIFEYQIAMDDLTDSEVLKLIDYPSYFDLTDMDLPDNKTLIINKLLDEGFIIEENANYSITNFGAILFAKNLNDFDTLKRKAPRVILYKGNSKIETIREQVGTKGYAVAFEGIINYINNLLPKNEIIGKAFREESKMYPDIAIRELVANSLIHQDFTITGAGPMFEVFDNRIEISNPGTPIVDILRFIDTNPKSRNEKIAFFMRRINICEERGSGIDKVVNSCETYQLPAPEFKSDSDINFTNAILYAYKDFKSMDKDDKIRACYQHSCLKYISREYMTNASLRDRFKLGKNSSSAWRIINDTIDAGFIRVQDPDITSKKFVKYVPFWA